MKANRKVVNGDDAVSPVIAVILMVAITVVLAATVYLWVSGFGSNQKQLVQASFGAKAIDLSTNWNDADATSEVDSDTSDDAIEITLASADADLLNTDVTISFDGQLLAWPTGVDMFTIGGSATPTAGQVCTTSPGGDADDLWERGASVILVDTTVDPLTLCDGQAALAADFGNLDGLHTIKVSVMGQVVLDTSIEVHDDAAS